MAYGNDSTESKALTLVLIPQDGGNLMQWRLPRFVWVAVLLLSLGVFGGASWVLWRHYEALRDLDEIEAQLESSRRIASELGQSRDEMLKVAQLELQLRRMLHYKSASALLKSDNIGGPSDDDLKQLETMLESPRAAEATVDADMGSLVASAQAQEKNFDDIRKYVDHKRSMLAAKPTSWPVHGWISSGFGARVNPFSGEKGFHTGIDIANDMGTPIHTTADGRVAYAGWEGGYGKLVVVEHGQGFSTYYGHLSQIKVAQGDIVRRGDVVGLMGQSGDATGPHLHYEVRIYNAPVDPTKYLQ